MKQTSGILAILASMIHFMSCAASAPNNGACMRSCGNRPIGGGKIHSVALTPAVSYTCSKIAAGSPVPNLPQQTYQFLVTEDPSISPTPATPPAGTTPDTTTSVPPLIPKAGIAFIPALPGYTPDNPSSEWCTDTCGIAIVQFTPNCNQQSFSVGIIIGSQIIDSSSGSSSQGAIASATFSVTQQ